MAGPASDFNHGDQDIHEQETTFHSVLVATKWSIVALAALIALLTLWFCTSAGFVSAFVTAAIIVAVGVFALRERSSAH